MFLTTSLFAMMACNSIPEKGFEDVMEMTKTLTARGDEYALIHRTKYIFSDGKPVSSNYENFSNPEYNANSIFQYDENDRIVAELQGGELTLSVSWDDNIATLTNRDGLEYGEVTMESGHVVRYRPLIDNNAAESIYQYDANGNVNAIESPEGELNREYLSYNLEKTHPSHLLKAIAPIRMSNAPFVSNIYENLRVQPIEGDDFSIGLAEYAFEYTFDENGRVETIEDELSATYTVWYDYL